jgi:hypothetical protein
VGDGAEAVLHYLARYVFRIAITESRIVGLDDIGVTIRHRHRASGRWRKTFLRGHEFMRRFLQHVLPKGFHKVRYSGLWHPSRRNAAARAVSGGWLYSITSSARTSSDVGTVNPIALAVLRLITSSNLVGRMTGRSAGLTPFRMRPT